MSNISPEITNEPDILMKFSLEIADERNILMNSMLLLTELRALAELIGPYGMKYLSEGLMRQISCQVDELKVMYIIHHN